MCGIVWCYTGPIKKAKKMFKPIRSFKAPALDMVGPIPHPVLQSMHDGLYLAGQQWYWKAAKEYWSALHPYTAGGAYVNFMMEEGEDRIRATYGKNYDRLAKIKKRYDPGNLFRVNQNIKPK
jgi:hypothetical protein